MAASISRWVYAGAGIPDSSGGMGAGNESFGAQLSLTIAGVSIQPSEFVKLTLCFVASMFYQSTDFKTIFLTAAVARRSCSGSGAVKGSGEAP